jgi:hypothetical protein
MERKRDWFLTIAAVLFALLALSNFLKPILADSHTGFVFFGRRLSGVPNDILGCNVWYAADGRSPVCTRRSHGN